MYRCYLIHDGRIARAEEFTAENLEDAIAQGRALLVADRAATDGSGIEIWQRSSLLYTERRHTSETAIPADIISPFATPDTVILPTWQPSCARPVVLSNIYTILGNEG
jgi:hypothetical protein